LADLSGGLGLLSGAMVDSGIWELPFGARLTKLPWNNLLRYSENINAGRLKLTFLENRDCEKK
jgi:hypothetical protein